MVGRHFSSSFRYYGKEGGREKERCLNVLEEIIAVTF